MDSGDANDIGIVTTVRIGSIDAAKYLCRGDMSSTTIERHWGLKQ